MYKFQASDKEREENCVGLFCKLASVRLEALGKTLFSELPRCAVEPSVDSLGLGLPSPTMLQVASPAADQTLSDLSDPCSAQERDPRRKTLFYYHGNGTCLRCLEPCLRCAVEVHDLAHPCAACVPGLVFSPLPEFEPGTIIHIEGDAATGTVCAHVVCGAGCCAWVCVCVRNCSRSQRLHLDEIQLFSFFGSSRGDQFL